MFLTGDPKNGTPAVTTAALPWYKNNTHVLMDIKDMLTNYNVSTHYTYNMIFNHIQLLSMLFMYRQQNRKTFSCLQDIFYEIGLTPTDITSMEEDVENFGDGEHPERYDYELIASMPTVKIVLITKNTAAAIAAYGKHFKDEKNISMIFQENVNHRVRVYQSNKNAVTIVCNKWTWDMARKLIALLPKLFPDTIKLSDSQHEICKLFGGNDFDAWAKAYNIWINSLNLRATVYKEKLNDLFKNRFIAQIKKHEADIQNYTKEITQYYSTITKYYRAVDEAQGEILRLQNCPTSDSSDLFDYLIANKCIKNWEVNPDLLSLDILCPLEYFDTNYYKVIANNPNANLFRGRPNYLDFCNMTFTETPRFEIWVSARCYIRISSKEIAFNNLDDSENIPQPHWHYYGCWGNNKTPITQALRNENYIGAIEQLIASAKNLNWADPPVIDTLRSKLTGSYTRLRTIKDLSTGEFISYEVACDIINKIKGEKTNA